MPPLHNTVNRTTSLESSEILVDIFKQDFYALIQHNLLLSFCDNGDRQPFPGQGSPLESKLTTANQVHP